MADMNTCYRANSFCGSEFDDAGSSSSESAPNLPVANAPPAIRLATSTSPSQLTQPALPAANPTVHTVPTFTASCTQSVSMQAMQLEPGVLTVIDVQAANLQIRDFLISNPQIHTVLIQPKSEMIGSTIDLTKQLRSVATLTTIKFDFNANADDKTLFRELDMEWENSFVDLLTRNASLTRLDLAALYIHNSILLTMLAGALENNPRIKLIDLTGSPYMPDPGLSSSCFHDGIATGMRDMIATCNYVNTILAPSRWINDEGAVDIGSGLKNNAYLQTLNLADNKIGHTGCAALFSAIRLNKRCALVTLNLAGSIMDLDAAVAFAKLIKLNCTLKFVSLGLVPDSKCLEVIYRGLKKNKHLVKLDIQSFEETDKRYQEISTKILMHFAAPD